MLKNRINKKERLYIVISLIGIFTLAGGLLRRYMTGFKNIQRMKSQLKMMDKMKNNSPFYCKKVIIRDDDIGDFRFIPSLEWISDLAMKKDIKITFTVIPATLVNNSETINYLNRLDKERFEFATHGYEHIHFRGISYEEQYSLIEKGTKVMEEYLHRKPCTFVPPFGSGDVNTTKVCRVLGYHSITDMIDYPSYVVDFTSDFGWEQNFHPVEHCSFEDFKSSFDNFYNSSSEYYIIFLHDWTFIDKEGKLDERMVLRFEKAIDYIKKNKNVQFVTIEEAYQWHVDENAIRTGMVSESEYFIDLKECRYNHTIKFSSPSNWGRNASLRDITTGEETMVYKNVFEFEGIRGHWYEMCEIQSTKDEK